MPDMQELQVVVVGWIHFLALREAHLRCGKRKARLSFPSPELISQNLPPSTCGERFDLGTTTPPSVRLKLDGKLQFAFHGEFQMIDR